MSTASSTRSGHSSPRRVSPSTSSRCSSSSSIRHHRLVVRVSIVRNCSCYSNRLWSSHFLSGVFRLEFFRFRHVVWFIGDRNADPIASCSSFSGVAKIIPWNWSEIKNLLLFFHSRSFLFESFVHFISSCDQLGLRFCFLSREPFLFRFVSSLFISVISDGPPRTDQLPFIISLLFGVSHGRFEIIVD